MPALTEAERRGAFVVLLLLAVGTGYDLVRAHLPARSLRDARTGPPPAAGDVPTASASPDSARPISRDGARLDLNRAGAVELDALPGIGPVLAGRIVAHRLEHGPFRSVEELRMVRGIGPALLERLRPRLVVSDTTAH